MVSAEDPAAEYGASKPKGTEWTKYNWKAGNRLCIAGLAIMGASAAVMIAGLVESRPSIVKTTRLTGPIITASAVPIMPMGAVFMLLGLSLQAHVLLLAGHKTILFGIFQGGILAGLGFLGSVASLVAVLFASTQNCDDESCVEKREEATKDAAYAMIGTMSVLLSSIIPLIVQYADLRRAGRKNLDPASVFRPVPMYAYHPAGNTHTLGLVWAL